MRRRSKACRLGVIATMLVTAALAVVGCTTVQSESDEKDPDELVGSPPADAEPFVYTGEPDETSRVGESGRLTEEASERESTQNEAPPKSADEAGEERPSREQSTDQTNVRCFSCVRICSERSDACGQGDGDVLCGWGIHDHEPTARDLAEAECGGALERERNSGQWSEVSGECPPAECRTSQ